MNNYISLCINSIWLAVKNRLVYKLSIENISILSLVFFVFIMATFFMIICVPIL